MKRTRLLLFCAAIVASATTANADLILQYDSITLSAIPNDANDGIGALGAFNVDSAFASNELSFIGSTDGMNSQGHGSVTTVNGQNGDQFTAVTTVGTGSDVSFSINPNGPLTGTTTDSLNNGNFIFFTFDAAQAFDLTELSVISDPNNGNSRYGARTAGAFVSLNGGTFTQFNGDVAQNNNAIRTNTFTDTLAIASGDAVEVRFAFTNELNAGGFQAATRIGSINVIGFAAVPEPSSLTLIGLTALGFCGFRRRR